MLAKVKIYKGIEFIELHDLPKEQTVLFQEWAPKEAFIKILIKDKIVSNCVQYKYYKQWFLVFKQEKAVVSPSSVLKGVLVQKN